jgi:hypothetical protein
VELAGPGGSETLPCTGLFSFIGANPASGWLSGCAALDDHGFVLTDRALRAEHLDGRWDALGRRPLPYETSNRGLFAAGDLRSGSTKRVAVDLGVHVTVQQPLLTVSNTPSSSGNGPGRIPLLYTNAMIASATISSTTESVTR